MSLIGNPFIVSPKKTSNGSQSTLQNVASAVKNYKPTSLNIQGLKDYTSPGTPQNTQKNQTLQYGHISKANNPQTTLPNVLQTTRYGLTQGTLGMNNGGNSASGGDAAAAAGAGSSPSNGGGGGYYSSTSVSGTNPYGSYLDQLQQLYAQQQANLNAYQRAQQQAAQNAYNNNMAALNNAYNQKLASLDKNLNNMKTQLASQYDYSKGNINTDADRSLKEAYVNRMLSQKNLQQQLSAQGLSGGASESAMAGLINNYGNARNEIDTTRGENLAGLEQTYNSNLADLMSNYESARQNAADTRLQYQMQLENALANNSTDSYGNLYNAMASLDSSYLSAMQNALANQAAYSAKQTSASNGVNRASTSGNTDLSTFNGALAYAKKNVGPSNINDFVSQLAGNGYSDADIAYILKKAGYPVSGTNGMDTSQGDAMAATGNNTVSYINNHLRNFNPFVPYTPTYSPTTSLDTIALKDYLRNN